MVYTRFYREEYIPTIHKNNKLRGIVEYTPEKETIVDYLAVSYHYPTKALEALLTALKNELEKHSVEKLVVPVDATKTALTKKLLEKGFYIENTVYKLVKKL